MKNFIKVGYVLLCLLVGASTIFADQASMDFENNPLTESRFSGFAYSMETGELLYSEHHSILSHPERGRVTSSVQYRSPSEQLIADKSLKYQGAGYFPDFHFKDLRTQQSLKVERTEKIITIIESENVNLKPKTKRNTLAPILNKSMVADAGFDVFMMKNWSSLISGKKQLVEFLAPTRSMFVTFEIKRTFINDAVVGFSLAPNNFFISMLVDPILLEYDLASGRILSYKGLTNIDEVIEGRATGSYHVAHIKYKYPDTPSNLALSNEP